MFLRNVWYLVALAADLPVETIVARQIIDIPIVLFCTASGAIGALRDQCGHCGLPLSESAGVADNVLRCRNGAAFSRIGSCVRVPGLERIPGDYAVRAYPVVERDGLVWLWPGSIAQADAAAVPSFPYRVDAAWAATSVQLEVEANWELVHDRLLDLNHLGSVHQSVARGPRDTRATRATSVVRDGRAVRVRRYLPDSEPAPFYRAAGGFNGTADRWKEIDFQPGVLTFFSGDAGIHTRHLHGITPVSETRTFYTFVQARNYQSGDDALTTKLHDLSVQTLRENRTALEARQRRMADGLEPHLVDVGVDAGPTHARRIIAELGAAEVAPPASSTGAESILRAAAARSQNATPASSLRRIP